MYMCACVCAQRRTCATVNMFRIEDNVQELALTFYLVEAGFIF